jgi:hypothetical protein
MFITKKHLARRTFLHGMGAAIALPLLDSMMPAMAYGKAANKSALRLGAVYLPNGMSMWNFTPATVGPDYELTRILQPLSSFRDSLVVVSGLSNKEADPHQGEGLGDHSRAQTAFLTGVHCRKTEGANLEAGLSMDQIAAREFGKKTQLASLELALESNEMAGSGEDGYSAAYIGTIAWSSPTTPLPMEANPRAVFERLFGSSDSTERNSRIQRLQDSRSILDSVSSELAGMQRVLGPGDRSKITEYLDSLRDIERRIQLAEEQSDRKLPVVNQPAGVPDTFEEYAKLMYDLMAISYQCDLTRVATFLYGREKSARPYPEIGVADPHHGVSHHQGRPELKEKLSKINVFHMQMFAYFLEKLRTTPDGDGTLLDHSLILLGGGMSDSNEHSHHDLPILLAGGGGQKMGGRHVRMPSDTPLANLHLTLLHKLGLPVENFADSTGEVAVLSGV